jgi:hypothetical protein
MHSDFSEQVPEFEAFPPGVYRLAWVGRIATVPNRDTPMVELGMVPIDSADGATIVLASIAHWPEFQIGTIWSNGQRQGRSLVAQEVETFDLTIGPGTQQLVSAYHKEPHGFLIPPFSYQIAREFAATQLLLIPASRQLDVNTDIIIPCTEIMRAYYGTSSRLAYHLLTGGFTYEANNRIYDRSRSWLQDGVAFVQISARMRNSDAHQIARLAFDPVAHANTLGIVRDSIAASNANQPYSVSVSLPFHGPTRLRVAGVPITTKRRVDGEWQTWTRFLALQVLHCTAAMPFDEVQFERDNPGAYGLARPQGRRLPTQSILDRQKSEDPVAKIHEDDDPNADAPVIFIDYETPPVFEMTTVTRIARDDAGEVRSRVLLESADPATSFSGGSSSSRGGEHTNIQFEPISAGEGSDLDPGSLAYFRSAVEGLYEEAGKYSLDIIADFTVVPLRWTKDAGPRTGWANVREGERARPRRLAVVSVSFAEHNFILLEIERRSGEKLSTLGIFSMEDTTLPHGVLERVKLVIVKNHGHLDNDERWNEHQLDDVERLSLHHHRSNVPATKYSARLLARMAERIGYELPKPPHKARKSKSETVDQFDAADEQQLAS